MSLSLGQVACRPGSAAWVMSFYLRRGMSRRRRRILMTRRMTSPVDSPVDSPMVSPVDRLHSHSLEGMYSTILSKATMYRYR